MKLDIGGDGLSRRCVITEKMVFCANASTMGYSTREARPGDWLVWQEDDGLGLSYGRVLGRIAQCDNDGADATGHIVVLWLHPYLNHASYRWVDPAWVAACMPASPRLLALVAGAPINSKTIKAIEGAIRRGEMSEHYIEKAEARIKEAEGGNGHQD